MTALVVQQMILASFGVGVISVLALLLRSTARHDAVLRYRILLVFLPLTLLIVPLQIAVAGLTPGWTRPPLEPVAALLPAVQWPAWLRPPETNLGAAAYLPETPQPGGAAAGRPVTRTQAGLGPGVLVAGYGAGVLVVLALGAPRVRAARRVLRDCRSITDPATRAVWEDVARAVGARGPIRLLQCSRLSVPACWGGWRPAVILPPDALAMFGEANLRCAIHHELLHLRRRDALAGVAELALVVGFWFHPLVWLYTRALAQDRELSCDALVVRATHKPRTYALALLEYCEKTLRPAAAAPLAGFGSVVTMQRRLKMIERAQTPVSRGRRYLVLAGVLAGGVGVAVGHSALAAALVPAPVAALSDAPSPGAEHLTVRIPASTAGAPMRAEIHALVEGRSDRDVLKHWMSFARQHDPQLFESLSSPGAWLTDQETAVSAWHARQDRNTLEADEILLNLPEGSWLRAVFTGARVSIEPTAEGARITVREGEVRIIDTGGVTRIVGRGTGETLDFTTSVENGEIVFRMRGRAAGGRSVPVRVELDLETGIPENEAQPPHGAIRWNLLIPDDPREKPTRLKMQWIYNLDELRRSVEGDEEATSLDPWGRER